MYVFVRCKYKLYVECILRQNELRNTIDTIESAPLQQMPPKLNNLPVLETRPPRRPYRRLYHIAHRRPNVARSVHEHPLSEET
jgi:hypothetical protein